MLGESWVAVAYCMTAVHGIEDVYRCLRDMIRVREREVIEA
jgi:hypothetical protein